MKLWLPAMGSLASNWQKLLIEELVSVQHPGPRSRRQKRNSVSSGFKRDCIYSSNEFFLASSVLQTTFGYWLHKNNSIQQKPLYPRRGCAVAAPWQRQRGRHLSRRPGTRSAPVGASLYNQQLTAQKSVQLVILFQFLWWNTPKVIVLIVACARINNQYSPSHLCFSVSDSHIFHQLISNTETGDHG